jgi:glycerophosphoryl diester phosphodiesterase
MGNQNSFESSSTNDVHELIKTKIPKNVKVIDFEKMLSKKMLEIKDVNLLTDVKEEKNDVEWGKIHTKTLKKLIEKVGENKPDIVYFLTCVPAGCNYTTLVNYNVVIVRHYFGFHESVFSFKKHINILGLSKNDYILLDEEQTRFVKKSISQ